MSDLPIKYIQAQINTFSQEHDNSVRAIAAEALDLIIKPFCREHNLKFTQGNGAWCFDFLADCHLPYRERRHVGGYIVFYDDFDDAGIDYDLALRALRINVTSMTTLFEYMDSFDPTEE